MPSEYLNMVACVHTALFKPQAHGRREGVCRLPKSARGVTPPKKKAPMHLSNLDHSTSSNLLSSTTNYSTFLDHRPTMNNFGVIEVASTKTTNAPGWAYVPDTPAHAIPSQSVSAVHLHVNRSKRAARAGAGGGGGASAQQQQHNDISARHDAKLHKEIEQLQRDSIAGQAVIPVPSGGQRDKDGKIRGHTPNVRRILASQKTFANHLDDFEAWSRTQQQQPQDGAGGSAGQSAAGTPAPSVPAVAKKAAGGSAASKKGGSSSKARSTSNSNKKSATPAPADLDVIMVDAPPPSDDPNHASSSSSIVGSKKEEPESTLLTAFTQFRPAPRPGDADPAPEPWPPAHHPGDDDPLLESWLPPLPTDEELRELVRAAPLSYTQARGVWPAAGAAEDEEDEGPVRYPARRFCEVCGYWGRVRCMKCGTRVCALDCLDVHREECVTRYGL